LRGPVFPPPGEVPPGAFRLPPGRREGGRLVYREPRADTLRPMAWMAALALAFCAGAVFAGEFVRALCLVAAGTASFLLFALAASLLRPREVVLDRDAGVIRLARAEHPPAEVPLAALRAVRLAWVRAGDAAALGAGLDAGEAGWIPLHAGWEGAPGGGEARARAVAEEVAGFLGLPVEGPGPDGAPAPPGEAPAGAPAR
jgi:hypothetical protein